MRRINTPSPKRQEEPDDLVNRAELAATGLVKPTLAQTGGPPVSSTTATTPDPHSMLMPLARLVARRAAREHLRRHRGLGLIEIAIGVGLAAVLLGAVFLLMQHLGGRS
jgi:hypothetical protein